MTSTKIAQNLCSAISTKIDERHRFPQCSCLSASAAHKMQLCEVIKPFLKIHSKYRLSSDDTLYLLLMFFHIDFQR